MIWECDEESLGNRDGAFIAKKSLRIADSRTEPFNAFFALSRHRVRNNVDSDAIGMDLDSYAGDDQVKGFHSKWG